MKVVATGATGVALSAIQAVLDRVLGRSCPFRLEGIPSEDVPYSLSLLTSVRQRVTRSLFQADDDSASYFIAVEPGAIREFDQYYGFLFASVADSTRNRFGFGTSTKFTLPDEVSCALERGGSFAVADLVAASLGGHLAVADLISGAVTVALAPFHFFEVPIPPNVPPELLKYVADLTPIERNGLAAQLRLLDFSEQRVIDQAASTAALAAVPDPTNFEDLEDDVILNGAQAIRAGEVAVLIMAGGQGSRLRAPVPKALMTLDTPSRMTLLEIQLRRVRKLLNLSGGSTGLTALDIPVYILTSESTHSPIAAYLLQKNNFGLRHVMLVKQRQLPARDASGRFVLSEKHKVMAAPNGNGAVFQELKDSGALDDMKRLGVKYVDVHPIDNVLARPADPFFVGALIYEGGEAAIKVIRKLPRERIGTLCIRDHKTVVIEYSEIPPGEEAAYQWGNTGLQLYTVDVIEKAAAAQLPYHIANKKEKLINDDGQQVIGDVVKFERFVFDALEYCENVVLVECKREDEFAPIKNGSGAPADSPETARDLLLGLHRRWAQEHDITLEGDGQFEFLPETTYDGEGLDKFVGFSFTLPISI